MTALVIVGDEAWTPEEWEAELRQREARKRRRKYMRDYMRTYRKQPGQLEYHRQWMAAYRASQRPVGRLHELSCPGDHTRPRKSCRPIPVFADGSAA